jgi:hypothetical protein
MTCRVPVLSAEKVEETAIGIPARIAELCCEPANFGHRMVDGLQLQVVPVALI